MIDNILQWLTKNISEMNYKFTSVDGTRFEGPGWIVFAKIDNTANCHIDDEKLRMLFILTFGTLHNIKI